MPTCSNCNEDLLRAEYSTSQLRKDPSSRKCKSCVKLITTGTTGTTVTTVTTGTTVTAVTTGTTGTTGTTVTTGTTGTTVTTVTTGTTESVFDEPAEIEDDDTNNVNNKTAADDAGTNIDIGTIDIATHANDAIIDAIITNTQIDTCDTFDVDHARNTCISPDDAAAAAAAAAAVPGDIHVDHLDFDIDLDADADALVVSVSDETPVKSNILFGDQAVVGEQMNVEQMNDDEFILDETVSEMEIEAGTENEHEHEHEAEHEENLVPSPPSQIQVIPEEVTCQTGIEQEPPQAPSLIRIGICAMDKKARSKPMVSAG